MQMNLDDLLEDQQLSLKESGTFASHLIYELSAALSVNMAMIGHELGFYKLLATTGPLDAKELSSRTGTHEKMVAEWLNNQAAGGYVDYHPLEKKYALPPEKAVFLADAANPLFMIESFKLLEAALENKQNILAAFRNKESISLYDHDFRVGLNAFQGAQYSPVSIKNWFTRMPELFHKLQEGAQVAVFGCGTGNILFELARIFPDSRFYGFDPDPTFIKEARQTAMNQELAHRVHFKLATAKTFGGNQYDLVCMFNTFNELSDPFGAALHTWESLSDDGTFLMVNPASEDETEMNHNPLGRLHYAISACYSVPKALSDDLKVTLGAKASPDQLRRFVCNAGFAKMNILEKDPNYMVLEFKKIKPERIK